MACPTCLWAELEAFGSIPFPPSSESPELWGTESQGCGVLNPRPQGTESPKYSTEPPESVPFTPKSYI